MPRTSKKTLSETVETYVACNRNANEAATQLGIAVRTLRDRIQRAKEQGLYEELPEDIPPVIQVFAKPVVRVRAITPEMPPEGPVIRVLGIGDAHDSPFLPDKSRFKWIGKHIQEWNPDYTVDIGDSCTFDSLCSYVRNDSYEGKLKPSITADLDSYVEAMDTLFDACPNWKGKFEKTNGNHEDRIVSFENRNPEVFGMVQQRYQGILDNYKINLTPYGKFRFIGGVGFIHTPMNLLSKPYGGKSMLPIGNDATFDIVYGHTHKQGVLRVPKIGPQNYVKIVNLGCALPWGHVEDYASKATTGWWWGVVELKIQGGHVVSENFIDMMELERRYA